MKTPGSRHFSHAGLNTREALGYFTQLRDLWSFQRAQPPLRQTYRRIAPGELT